MTHVDLAARTRGTAAATVFALLMAGTCPTAQAASDQTAATGLEEDRKAVVCLAPRPTCAPTAEAGACPAMTAELLRRGLFHICEGYRTGRLSADEYRAGLLAYPSLIAQLATLELLDQPRFGGPTTAEAQTVAGWLNANPALSALCRSMPAEEWSANIATTPRLAAPCLLRLTSSMKE